MSSPVLLIYMCGRYVLNAPNELLEERFNAIFDGPYTFPSFNISPSLTLPVITNEDHRIFQMVKWGLKPRWMTKKDGIINVRSETLRDKATFKKNLEEKRCIVPATGYYEWQTKDGKKIPYYFRLKDEEIFSFAGIWGDYKDDEGEVTREFAIITTTPNEISKDVHNRMPVILSPKDEKLWLSEDRIDLLDALMSSFPTTKMSKHIVTTKINNPRFNDSEAINPI